MLDISFGVGVDGGGCFIKNENGCLGCEGAGKIQTLPLTARKVFPSFFDGGIIISPDKLSCLSDSNAAG